VIGGVSGNEASIVAGAANENAAADGAGNETKAGAPDKPARPRPNRNRGMLPVHLPRVDVVIDVESKVCPCCGGSLHKIGETIKEMLDVVPVQYQVKRMVRPRYGCRGCESAVVQAPAPAQPIDGGMATEAVLAHVATMKYGYQVPLYRQEQMLTSQGIDLDRATLALWMGRLAWWLKPLHEVLLDTILSYPKLFADETPLPVLDPGRGKTKTCRGWPPWMTGHGAARRRRRWCMRSRKIARASAQRTCLRGSMAFCRSMVTLATMACSIRRDQRAAARLVERIVELVQPVGRVDAHQHQAGPRGGELRQHPFGVVGRPDADAVARLQPQGQETGGQPVDRVAKLSPCQPHLVLPQ
jgi:transposase